MNNVLPTDDASAAAAAEMGAPNPVEAAINAALAKLEDPMLTPLGYLRTVLGHARAIPVHATRQAQAAAALDEFITSGIKELRTHVANMFTRLPDLTRKLHALSAPPPSIPEIERIDPILRAAGWSSGEIDLLRHALKPGEKMSRCDAGEARFDTRTLTRRALRDGGRPAWWSSAPGWNQKAYENQFANGAPIPGEREGQRSS